LKYDGIAADSSCGGNSGGDNNEVGA